MVSILFQRRIDIASIFKENFQIGFRKNGVRNEIMGEVGYTNYHLFPNFFPSG